MMVQTGSIAAAAVAAAVARVGGGRCLDAPERNNRRNSARKRCHMRRSPYSCLGTTNTQVFVPVENAMVDGAATGALQAPSVASSSGNRPGNDTNALPVVPAAPAPGEASGSVAAASFTTMRKIVEFKEMGMGALASTCGLGMALKAMADSEKNPILIDGALSLYNLLVAALATRATAVLPRRCERV